MNLGTFKDNRSRFRSFSSFMFSAPSDLDRPSRPRAPLFFSLASLPSSSFALLGMALLNSLLPIMRIAISWCLLFGLGRRVGGFAPILSPLSRLAPRRGSLANLAPSPSSLRALENEVDERQVASIDDVVPQKLMDPLSDMATEDVTEADVFADVPAASMNGTPDAAFSATGSGAEVAAPTNPQSNSLATWQRRLITKEDPFSVHKLASIGYTITSATLLVTAAVQALKGEFANIPASMEPVMNAFTVCNVVMCTASIRMAFIHRRKDIASRNAFLGTAVSSLFSGFFMVWISPFAEGDMFNDIWISRLSFAVLVGINVFFIADSLMKQEELIEGRRDRRAEDYDGRILVDTLGYIFPVAFGLPLVVATGYLASIAHDRAFYFEQCQFIDKVLRVPGTPGMQSHIFYQQLSTSLGASYASLFVTLRDKKLITKNQELAGIALFALPAFVWSVYTTYYFGGSLMMER